MRGARRALAPRLLHRRRCRCTPAAPPTPLAQQSDLLALEFGQWQGADPTHRQRYSEGAAALAQSVRALAPGARHEAVQLCGDGVAPAAAIAQQQAEASALLRSGPAAGRVITLGGDCGVEPVPIGYLNERHGGQLVVIWLDAHGDLNTAETSPSGHYHGMALWALLDPPATNTSPAVVPRPLLPEQLVLAGVRSLDPAEEAFLASSAIPVLPPSALLGSSTNRIHGSRSDAARTDALLAALRSAGMSEPHTQLYVHLDLDVLEPSQFPHVAVPEAGGLPPAVLLAVCAAIREEFGERVCGVSVTELALGRQARPQQRAAATGYVGAVLEALLGAG